MKECTLFYKGDNNEIAKMDWQNLCLLLQNIWANFNQLGTKSFLIKGIRIHFLSKEVPSCFTKGDNCEIAKIDEFLKILFFRTTWPILTELILDAPSGFSLMKGHVFFQVEMTAK